MVHTLWYTQVDELRAAIEDGQHRKIKLLHQKDETLMYSKHKLVLHPVTGEPVFETMLNYATRIGSKKTVMFLIGEFKLDLRETGASERNCIFAAIECSKFETAKYLHSLDETLIRAKDDNGDSGMCFASRFGSKEIVQWLIEEVKCDILETGFRGQNCFLAAIVGGKIETVNYLHSVNESLIKSKAYEGNGALTLAITDGSKEMVQLLIEKYDLDVHEADPRGWNCFHHAVSRGQIKTLEYLNSIKPVLSQAKTNHGSTAWDFAVGNQPHAKNAIEYLINRPFPDHEAVIFADEESCVECRDAQPSLMFLPCKHIVACKICVKTNYQEFKNCPNCKSKIDFVYTVELETEETVKQLKRQLQDYKTREQDYKKREVMYKEEIVENRKHYGTKIATLKSENSKTLRKNANDVAELTSTRSLLNDSRKDCSKLKTKVEKLQLLTNKKQKENECLKNQVTEQVNNKNEHDKLKKCQKQLLKEYKIQIETIKNYETAAEESKTEVEEFNVTIANLNYDLTLVREAKTNEKKVLNARIEKVNSEVQELKNALSAERMKVDRFEKIKIKHDTIKPYKTLDDSTKFFLERARVSEKSNAEKEDQIAELSRQLVDRYFDLDKREKDADALKNALVKVEFWKKKAERQCQAMTEFEIKMGDLGEMMKQFKGKEHNQAE